MVHSTEHRLITGAYSFYPIVVVVMVITDQINRCQVNILLPWVVKIESSDTLDIITKSKLLTSLAVQFAASPYYYINMRLLLHLRVTDIAKSFATV